MRRWEALADKYLTTFRTRGLTEDYIKDTGRELDRWGAWLKRRKPKPKLERVKKRQQEPSVWKFCLYVGKTTQIKRHKRARSVSGVLKTDHKRRRITSQSHQTTVTPTTPTHPSQCEKCGLAHGPRTGQH